MAWTRQRHIWGTTTWATDYGRRAVVESGNAEIETHRLLMDRGFTRVLGTTKNSVLIAFALAGVNHTLLRAWHAKRDLPDPWAALTGEPDQTRTTHIPHHQAAPPRLRTPQARLSQLG